MTEENKQAEAPKVEQPAAGVQPEKNNPANPANPAAPDLTVTDLQALKTIIDVASQRGTFKASEMAVVGNTYNRLTQFLDAINPPKPEGQAAPEPQSK